VQKFKPEATSQLYLLPPSVEDFVPENHLSRIVKEVVETIDTNSIETAYSHLGQKSYSPKLLLRLLFYGYAIGIRSGRKIATACESDTAFMFLANMYKPDFRTINDFRKDNILFIHDAFVQIVRLCQSIGMCQVGTLTIDGTKIKANASGVNSKTKKEYQQWLEKINKEIKDILQEADKKDQDEDDKHGDTRGNEVPKELSDKNKLKAKIEKALSSFKTDGSKERVNLHDTEAKFIKGNGRIVTNYNCQAAISEDDIIVCAYADNNPSDRTETVRVVQRTEANTNREVKVILADSGYATYDNYEHLEDAGKACYIPDQQWNTEKEKALNPYHRSHFKYSADKNHFICPEGQIVSHSHQATFKKSKQQSHVYICKACPDCDKQTKCTKGKFRQIHLEKREHLRTRIRKRLKSIEGRIKYLKRMRIEGVFGNLKHNLNYKHLYLNGIKKTTAEWQLMCIGHNLKKIHQYKRG